MVKLWAKHVRRERVDMHDQCWYFRVDHSPTDTIAIYNAQKLWYNFSISGRDNLVGTRNRGNMTVSQWHRQRLGWWSPGRPVIAARGKPRSSWGCGQVSWQPCFSVELSLCMGQYGDSWHDGKPCHSNPVCGIIVDAGDSPFFILPFLFTKPQRGSSSPNS